MGNGGGASDVLQIAQVSEHRFLDNFITIYAIQNGVIQILVIKAQLYLMRNKTLTMS